MTTVTGNNEENQGQNDDNQKVPDFENMSPEMLTYYLDEADGPTRENILRIIKDKVKKTIEDNGINCTPWTDEYKAKILMQNVVTTDDITFAFSEISRMGLDPADYEQYLPSKEEIDNPPSQVFLSKELLKFSLLCQNFIKQRFFNKNYRFISSDTAYYAIRQELIEEIGHKVISEELLKKPTQQEEYSLFGTVPPFTSSAIFIYPIEITGIASFAETVAVAKVLKADYLLHIHNEWSEEEIKAVDIEGIKVITLEKFIQMVVDNFVIIDEKDKPSAKND
ncbi:MAG: hypothetical protein WCV41_02515 [Patescibacteria group bacterium]